jgi:hypothetical protein
MKKILKIILSTVLLAYASVCLASTVSKATAFKIVGEEKNKLFSDLLVRVGYETEKKQNQFLYILKKQISSISDRERGISTNKNPLPPWAIKIKLNDFSFRLFQSENGRERWCVLQASLNHTKGGMDTWGSSCFVFRIKNKKYQLVSPDAVWVSIHYDFDERNLYPFYVFFKNKYYFGFGESGNASSQKVSSYCIYRYDEGEAESNGGSFEKVLEYPRDCWSSLPRELSQGNGGISAGILSATEDKKGDYFLIPFKTWEDFNNYSDNDEGIALEKEILVKFVLDKTTGKFSLGPDSLGAMDDLYYDLNLTDDGFFSLYFSDLRSVASGNNEKKKRWLAKWLTKQNVTDPGNEKKREDLLLKLKKYIPKDEGEE